MSEQTKQYKEISQAYQHALRQRGFSIKKGWNSEPTLYKAHDVAWVCPQSEMQWPFTAIKDNLYFRFSFMKNSITQQDFTALNLITGDKKDIKSSSKTTSWYDYYAAVPHIIVKEATPRGGLTVVHSTSCAINSIDMLGINESIDAILNNIANRITIANGFGGRVCGQSGKIAENKTIIKTAECLNIVHINDNGHVLDNVTSPNNQNVWFLIRIHSNHNNHIIVYNGESWAAVTGTVMLRLCEPQEVGMKPAMTDVDKEILDLAISIFASKD